MKASGQFLLKLRPAPLASFIASICGLNKRRLVATPNGTFFINPVSNFGTTILKGEYEPQMRKVLNRYLPYGGTFIDLGANEGYFSVLASHIVGPEGRVVAIEPQSRLQEVIRENLSVNHCSNVRLIRCVVAGETGRMRLSLAPSTNTGSSSLFRGTKYPIPTEEVESFNLADLLDKADLDSCDLMKVDIEGAEYDVFMAAKEVLEKGILRNIALEYHEGVLSSRGLSREELHDQMIESGYEINQDFGHCLYSFRR